MDEGGRRRIVNKGGGKSGSERSERSSPINTSADHARRKMMAILTGNVIKENREETTGESGSKEKGVHRPIGCIGIKARERIGDEGYSR